jgi:hypothetical protein
VTITRRILLLAALLVTFLNNFPAWADWLGLAVVLVLLAWEVGKWAYATFYDKPRTFSLRLTDVPMGDVPLASVWVGLELAVRRPISITKARICLSDTRDGKRRPAQQKDLLIVDVTDGSSPSQIPEGSIKRSFSRLELWCRDDPILVDPEEPLYLSIRLECRREWSGYLVFVGWDEDGRRRFSSVSLSLTPVALPFAAAKTESADASLGGTPRTDDKKSE